MSESRRIVGDCRVVLRQLIEEGVKVQCVISSPPYWGLRSYLNSEHEDKSLEIGREKVHDCMGWATGNPCGGECHVCVIVDVFRLVREVLADDGTLWINYGDSYATSMFTRQGKPRNVPQPPNDWEGTDLGDRGRAGNYSLVERHELPGLKPKDLVGMPWRIALALQADGWWLRSDIIFSKKNPMPESVTDRPTRSHEYLFLLAKSPRYFYDSEAIKEPGTGRSSGRIAEDKAGVGPGFEIRGGFAKCGDVEWHSRNRRSVWEIATEPFKESHFAVFPRALVTPCILAGTSQMGHCPECGARWVREVDRESIQGRPNSDSIRGHSDSSNRSLGSPQRGKMYVAVTTTGWRPTCECKALFRHLDVGQLMPHQPIPDVVLDPFGGSGTVGQCAEQLGRKYILIDLSADYERMQKKRTAQMGMAL